MKPAHGRSLAEHQELGGGRQDREGVQGIRRNSNRGPRTQVEALVINLHDDSALQHVVGFGPSGAVKRSRLIADGIDLENLVGSIRVGSIHFHGESGIRCSQFDAVSRLKMLQ